jgi:dihydrofolate reductase
MDHSFPRALAWATLYLNAGTHGTITGAASPLGGRDRAFDGCRGGGYSRGMGRLIYLMNVSLDGFVETPDHDLGWARIDDELHAWFNEQTRRTDVMLYGRRLYEVMSAHWPFAADLPDTTPVELEFARLWNETPRVVFSRTLERVEWNSRLNDAPIEETLAALRAEYDGELAVAGPTLAAEFVRRDLVDEYRMVVHPVVLSAGTPYFPDLPAPLDLELVDTRRFASGVMYLGYARQRGA